MPFNLYRVSEVELAAWIATDGEKPATRVPIRIAHPNSCSLKYDERDLKLRAMLEASGIELKEPSREAPGMRPRRMSPEAVLIEVLDRVAGSRDHMTRISARELAGWPADAVAALKSQRLLRRSRPATSVICPGCEQQCAMPVYTVVGPGASAGQTDRWSFVVCDKRDDINRVTVEPDRLTRWQSSPDAVCDFVADCLGLRPSRKRTGAGRA